MTHTYYYSSMSIHITITIGRAIKALHCLDGFRVSTGEKDEFSEYNLQIRGMGHDRHERQQYAQEGANHIFRFRNTRILRTYIEEKFEYTIIDLQRRRLGCM